MGTERRDIPKFQELMNPLLEALHRLGGSGALDEIFSMVVEIMELPDDLVSIPHDSARSSQSEIEYRLAWARSWLKRYGILANSERGVWVIVPERKNVRKVDPREVLRTVRKQLKSESNSHPSMQETEEDVGAGTEAWREKLHHVLTRELTPDAFERLIKRVLRESGFVQVEVTGGTGDQGIDGKGIVKVGSFLSFHVLFQCKRYQGSISSSAIRDFRGALIGRADKGLFLTTGGFTRDAIREATRDGATPIDLIDGDQLADTLKRLGLGVETRMVESVETDLDWYRKI